MATLLATEVIENEFEWLNYDFEEAQVRIDLGDMILEHLVTETISVSDKINQNIENSESIYSEKFSLVKQKTEEIEEKSNDNKGKE